MNWRDLHNGRISNRRHKLHRNLVTILVLCFLEVEYGEDRRSNDKQCRVHKFTSWTDPLASTKRQRDPRILSESPVFVEKSFGFEFLWIRVYLRIVQDRPELSQIYVRIGMDETADVPCIGYHYGSCWAQTSKQAIEGQNGQTDLLE